MHDRDFKNADDPAINPYAPPDAALGEAPVLASSELAEAEATRRIDLNPEASVRSLGSLHLLGAILSLLGLIAVGGFLVSQLAGGSATPMSNVFIVVMVLYLAVVGGISLALGLGLRKLQPWARWVDTAFIGLSIAANVVQVVSGSRQGLPMPAILGMLFGSSLIPGYMLYLLLSRKATVIFSPEYREIIRKTPHIQYKTSCLVKGVIIVFLAVIGFAIAAAFIGYLRSSR
ncbi:MAG: hypothetical protein NVSMB9_32940 [Isosphaeraceae bacterium]